MKKTSQKTVTNSPVKRALLNSYKGLILLFLTIVSVHLVKAGNPSPVLSIEPDSLTDFTTFQNQASMARTYSLIATNLGAGETATITAPDGYEISVQGTSTFSSTLTIEQTAAGVISKTLEVRLKAQPANNSVTGNIIHTVAGLIRTVALSGMVKPALPFNSMSREESILVGLHEERMLQLNAYPDPAPHQFTVRFESSINYPVQVLVFDLEGNLILKQELPFVEFSQELNLCLEGQSAGQYILEVIAGTERSTSTIIKS